MKRAQFRDERGKWRDMPMTDFRLTPETVAFQAAKQQGLVTRVVEEDKDGELKVLNLYRSQKGRSQR
jgi:hypothetical protein